LKPFVPPRCVTDERLATVAVGFGSLAGTDDTGGVDVTVAGVADEGWAVGPDDTTLECTTLATSNTETPEFADATPEAGATALDADSCATAQLGTEGLTSAGPVTASPLEADPTARPMFAATGASSSMTATTDAIATSPPVALMAAVHLRRRRDRLGLTEALRPLQPRLRGHTAEDQLARPPPPTTSYPSSARRACTRGGFPQSG
jgi:hypothetical protein